MATVTININGINEGWTGASGSVTDIDEAIADADGNEYGPGAETDAATFDLSAHGLSDSDTITNVSITVRARDSGTAGTRVARVELIVGGTSQGTPVNTGSLTSSFSDEGPLNDSGWNTDWTASQLDGMQIRLTAVQSGMPGTNALAIDCADVVITYTEAATDDVDFAGTNPGAWGAFVMPKALSTYIPYGMRIAAEAEEPSGASPATIAFVSGSATTDATSQTTYTFSSVNIGTPTSTRIVAVSFHAETTIGTTVDSATIGGSGATIAVQVERAASPNVLSAIIYLLVTSGTTATIAVTLSAAASHAAITVHEVNTTTGTPSDTDSGVGTSSASMSALTIPSNGVALCVATNGGFNSYTWTNADETTDFNINFLAEASTATIESAGTPTITATATGNTALVGAAWGP